MRRRLFSACVLARTIICLTVLPSLPAHGSANPPVIVVQPSSVTADYGSVVTLSVVATGEALTYQWQKNQNNLSDFYQVAGSSTATLYLAGVAEDDVSRYQVIVSNPAGSVTSSVVKVSVRSKVIFTDDFESGLTNWQPLMESTPMTVDGSQNHSPGGTQAAFISNSGQEMYHRLKGQRSRVRLSVWFYDDGGSVPAYAEMRAYSGPEGYAHYVSHGLLQLFAIGRCNEPFGAPNTGTLTGETLDPTKYQGRILAAPNSGWFNLNENGAHGRSVGWHLFQIERDYQERIATFYVDGVKARQIDGGVPAVFAVAFDTLTIGSRGTGQSNEVPVISGSAWFDDVKFAAYPRFFDYENFDSSGRGMFPDWMKLRETGTNWNVLNVASTVVSMANGARTNGGMGDWVIDGQGICAGGMRGTLDYVVQAPSADAYRLEIEGREKDSRIPAVNLPLNISIDGELLGRFNVPYDATTNGLVHCFTPFIQAGPHTVHIEWDNCEREPRLYVQGIRLQSLSGSAVNSSGMKLWVANRLLAQNGMEYAPASSLVSPTCIEGRGQYLSMMNLVAGTGYPLATVPIHHGTGYRWYANVPLSAAGATRVQATYQNGAFTETNDITWQISNLLGTNSGAAIIRKGDSLLFAAIPAGTSNGPATIQVGPALVTNDVMTPVPYQFNQPGTFTVTGTFLPTGASGNLTVTVVDASLDDHRACFVNNLLNKNVGVEWDCTNLPPGVVLDADPRLRVVFVPESERQQRNPAPPPLGVNGREYDIWDYSTEPRYVLARLGTNGPGLASSVIEGFRWYLSPNTPLRLLGTQDDGSQLVEGTFLMSPVLPTVSVGLNIVTGGVTLQDGSVTRTLNASDFDGLGLTRLMFVRAANLGGGVCNLTKLYDNGVLVGLK